MLFMARYVSQNLELPVDRVDYMDVSQTSSCSCDMYPFLENDDSNRALMVRTCNVKLFHC